MNFKESEIKNRTRKALPLFNNLANQHKVEYQGIEQGTEQCFKSLKRKSIRRKNVNLSVIIFLLIFKITKLCICYFQ